MEEKKIICKDCNNEFIFSVGEQNFYKDKGLSDPIRCKDCRKKRKADKPIQKEEKTQEQKNIDFEEMLERFRANTVLFEQERNHRMNKKKR